MQAWEVGVSLLMTSNIEKEVIAIGRSFLGLHNTIKDVETTLKNLGPRAQTVARSFIDLGRTIGGALAVGGVGIGLLDVMTKITMKAKDLNAEMIKLNLMGRDESQRAATYQEAQRIANNVRGSTQAGAMSTIGKMQTVLPFDQALKFGQMGEEFAKAYSGSHPGMSQEQAHKDMLSIIRSGERAGRVQDPKTHMISMDLTQKWLDTVLQVNASSQGQIGAREWEALTKRAGIALRSRSDRGIRAEAFLGQQMGADQAGTAAMSEFMQNEVGRMTVPVAEQMMRYGFLKPGSVGYTGGGTAAIGSDFSEFGIHGGISGLRRARNAHGARQGRKRIDVSDDAWTDPEMAKAKREDPVEFIKLLTKGLMEKGITDPAQLTQAIGQLTGRNTTFRRQGELQAGMGVIGRDVDQSYLAKSVKDAIKTLDNESLDQAIKNFSSSWTVLTETISGPGSKVLIMGLNALESGIRGLTTVLQGFDRGTLDTVVMGLAAIGTALAVGGTIRIALAVTGWLAGGLANLGGLLGLGGSLAMALGPGGWMLAGFIAFSAWMLKEPFTVAFKNIKADWNKYGADWLAKQKEWFQNLTIDMNNGLDHIIEEVKSWPDKMKAATTEFGNKVVENIQAGLLKALGKLANPAGPGAGNPIIQNSYPGGGYGGLIHPANLPGSGGSGSWSDIGQGHLSGGGAGGSSGGSSSGLGSYGGLGRGANDNMKSYAGGNLLGRSGGSRSWRNNNPGNIEYGPFARSLGAIGSDGRFAIFPTEAAGRLAQEKLLFEGKNYRDKTLSGAIHTWAPASENNVPAYIRALGGDGSKRMSEYTTEERKRLMSAMQRHEGWRVGTQYSGSGGSAAGGDPGRMGGSLAGLTMKPGANVRPVHEGVAELAKEIQKSVPGFQRFSAMNDHFHLGRPGSLHNQGLAADFTAPGDHRRALAAVRGLMESRGLGPKDYQLIDEYDHPSQGSTGGHIHAGFRSRAAAEKFRRSSMVPPSGEAGRTTQVHTSINLDGRKVASSVTRHQGEFANGPSHGGQGFDRTRTFAGNDSGFRTAV